jgi:hypothetical protein
VPSLVSENAMGMTGITDAVRGFEELPVRFMAGADKLIESGFEFVERHSNLLASLRGAQAPCAER